MLRNFSPLLKISLYVLLLGALLWACKKEKDLANPKPEEEVGIIIPGETVGYGAKVLDKAAYEKIPLIQEPQIAPSANFRVSKAPALPSAYDFSSKMPPVLSQGRQGSCTAWAVGYAALSYVNAVSKGTFNYQSNAGVLDESNVHSPAYIYNQTKATDCSGGAYLYTVLDLIKAQGACKLKDMAYNQDNCDVMPTPDQKQLAANFKIKDWGRIKIETNTFRKFLYYDYPLIISARLDHNFKYYKDYKDANGEYIWNADSRNDLSYHAMVIVGYDDTRKAFKIQNSWGPNWANKGFIWLSYNILSEVILEAYIIVPGQLPNNLITPQVVTEDAVVANGGDISLKGRFARIGDSPIIRYGIAASYNSQQPTDQIEVIDVPIIDDSHEFSVTAPKTVGTLYFRAFAETPHDVYYGETKTLEVKGGQNDASGDILYFHTQVLDAGNGKLIYPGPFFQNPLDDNFNSPDNLIFHKDYYIIYDLFTKEVHAFGRSDHSLKWKQTIVGLNKTVTTPRISNDILFLTTMNGLSAIDIKTGAKKWDFPEELAGVPYIKGDTVYFGSMNKPYRSLDAKTGKLIREYSVPGRQGRDIPVVYQEKLFLLSSEGVFAYHILTGEILWKNQDIKGYDGSTLLMIVNGSLCLLDPSQGASKTFVSLSTHDGRVNWKYTATEIPSYHQANDKYLVLRAANNVIRNIPFEVVDVTSGKQKWKKEEKDYSLDFVLVDNIVYVGTSEAITAYNADSGAIIWKTPIEHGDQWTSYKPYLVKKDGKVYTRENRGR
jgi:outer membrane protein assembly factor BamB